MSTTYRAIIRCDEKRGHDCLGVVQYDAPDPQALSRRWFQHERRTGWLRGDTVDQTYDVCPVCRPAVEREREREVPVVPEVARSEPSPDGGS